MCLRKQSPRSQTKLKCMKRDITRSGISNSLMIALQLLCRVGLFYVVVAHKQVLKFWLEGGGRGGKRTFMELRDALKSCNQQTASDVVLRRLQSPGLTLRTSPVL